MSATDLEPAAAPSATPQPPVRDHAFDGIQEYDNPMPSWWKNIFWVTIFFSVGYFFYYHLGVGENAEQAYDRALGEFYAEQAAKLGDLQPDEATLVGLMGDPKMMAAGRALYRANCTTCHAADGGGGTGPNLTDDHFLNIRRIEDLHTMVRDGLVGKGMPAWGDRFSPPQLVVLSSYVASLRGTTPASGKAPEGQVIAPWPAPAPRDEAAPATE
jgi:cytochrome c oxidase cbb3-type subunit 3